MVVSGIQTTSRQSTGLAYIQAILAALLIALAVVLAAGIVYMLVRKDPYKNTSMEVKRSVA